MSDPSMASMPGSQTDPENKLTSERFDEFKEALEVLYIIANISGRIQFAQKWEDAAVYVLGEELIQCDYEGTDDKERRAEFEQEAEARRLALLELMDTIEEKSVEKDALQIDFVREQVEKMGRDLALLIYGRKIVDRFIAPPPEPVKSDVENKGGLGEAEISQGLEGTMLPDIDAAPISESSSESPFVVPVMPTSDLLNNVKPIDVSSPEPLLETPSAPSVDVVVPAQEAPVAERPLVPQAEPSTQKAVSMKFVSSKDQKKKENPSGAPPSDQAG